VYLATILITIPVSEDEIRGLAVGYTLIPITGPFIALGNDNDDLIVDPVAPLIVSGVLQIVSVGMIIAGLAIKRDVKEKPLSFRNHDRSLQMSLAPAAFGRNGAGALLTFTHF
jgi:hypothetical protein